MVRASRIVWIGGVPWPRRDVARAREALTSGEIPRGSSYALLCSLGWVWGDPSGCPTRVAMITAQLDLLLEESA